MKKIFLLPVIIGLFILTSCSSYFEENGTVFNTSYQIKYQADELMTEKIEAELLAINQSLNPFNPNSIIAKVNRNEPVEVDEYFKNVFNKSMQISEKSNGIFDITCAPMINIWGFGFSKMDSVTPALIDSVKQFVGYRKVRLEGNRVIKDDPRLMLNCSAIAKGYACDVIAEMFDRNGVKNYMVEIGGEVTLKGVNSEGNPWRVGIRKPELVGGGRHVTIEEVIQLPAKGGVATSGDYQNFYIKDGKKYAHTINPLTGYPAEQNILSSSVVANDCMTADAWATAFNAMGLEEACRIGDSVPELEYFFIYTDDNGDYKFKYSKGMIDYLPNRKQLAVLENP